MMAHDTGRSGFTVVIPCDVFSRGLSKSVTKQPNLKFVTISDDGSGRVGVVGSIGDSVRSADIGFDSRQRGDLLACHSLKECIDVIKQILISDETVDNRPTVNRIKFAGWWEGMGGDVLRTAQLDKFIKPFGDTRLVFLPIIP